MSRFVFWEALAAAAPLHAGLAALQMRLALAKLALKYNPAQPSVPAGNRDGGQWRDAGGWVRVAANDRGEGAIATDAGLANQAHGLPKFVPKNADIERNIAEAEKHGYSVSELAEYPELELDSARWFYGQVNDGGPWDYKLQGSEFEDFGNFNYGATGKALGFSEDTLLHMAGVKQLQDRHARQGWGVPVSIFQALLGVGGVAPFGDDPKDQEWIKRGFRYYDSRPAK